MEGDNKMWNLLGRQIASEKARAAEQRTAESNGEPFNTTCAEPPYFCPKSEYRQSLTDKLRTRRAAAYENSKHLEALRELCNLLEANPAIARILDLMEIVKV
jgi:hypothetical protein